MLKCETVCGVLYLLAVFLQFASANYEFLFNTEEQPYIRFEIEGNYTAAAGSSFTVECKANVPIKLVHRSTKNTTFWDVDYYPVGDDYESLCTVQQTLTDLTYRDVGWFDCLVEGSPENNVTFYLFVDDPAHLMLGPEVIRISARRKEVVVVPCFPTAPDVNVSLLTTGGNTMSYSTDPKDEDTDKYYYHPTRGFILPGKRMTAHWYIYICEFTKRGVKQRNHINIFLDSSSTDLVYLEPQGGSETKDVRAKPGTDVLLTAEVFTSYDPTGQWYDKENNEIKTGKKYTITHLLSEPWETRLYIHNVSSSDAGIYSVKAGHSDAVSYTLHVGDIQTLEIDMDNVFLVSSDNFVAHCRETPARRIWELSWTIRWYNCQQQHGCENTVSSLKSYQDVDDIEFNPKSPHAILLKKPMLANITCAMKYLDGSEANVTRPLIVSEAKDGFEIEHKYDKYFSDKTLALTCTVSRFLYSGHLYWIGHDRFVIEKNRTEDGRNMTVTRSETDYSYRVTLMIQMDADYTPQIETYRCMAVDHQHVPAFKSHELNLYSAAAPRFFSSSNMRNESLFLRAENYRTLTCYAGGMPSPTLRWYKDDIKIGTDVHNELRLGLQMNDSGRYSCRAANDFGEYSRYMNLEVYYPVNVTINDTDTVDGWSLEGRVSERVILLCHDDAESVYNFTWFRDDDKVYESSSIHIRDYGSILSFFPVKAQDSGFYTCRSHRHENHLIVEDSPSIVAPVLGSIFAIALVFALIYLGLRVRRLNTLGTPISYRNLLSKRM